MENITFGLWVLLFIAAFAAGWLDAIGGGGGLLQLPALLLALPVSLTPSALGTSKLSAIIGTSAAARTYALRVRPPLHTVRPMMIAAFIGSALGSTIASRLRPDIYRPIILVLLIVVWLITMLNPTSKVREIADHEAPVHSWVLPVLAGAGLGFYDGAIGPGTGVFLLVVLVQVFGLSFLRASATAKFVNVATNGAAILIFAAAGHVIWALGLSMGVANLAGGVLGSRMAIRYGSEFVRRVLLGAVALLIVRLAQSILF